MKLHLSQSQQEVIQLQINENVDKIQALYARASAGLLARNSVSETHDWITNDARQSQSNLDVAAKELAGQTNDAPLPLKVSPKRKPDITKRVQVSKSPEAKPAAKVGMDQDSPSALFEEQLEKVIEVQMKNLEVLNGRIYDLHRRLLGQQNDMINRHAETIQSQTLEQMKKWQQIQLDQMQWQNEHNSRVKQTLSELNSNVHLKQKDNNGATASTFVAPRVIGPKESGEMKQQLDRINADFQQFLGEVHTLQERLQESKAKRAINVSKNVETKAKTLEERISKTAGEYRSIEKDIIKSQEKIEMVNPMDDFNSNVYALLGDSFNNTETQIMLEDIMDKRIRVEKAINEKYIVHASSRKASTSSKRMTSDASVSAEDFDWNAFSDPVKVEQCVKSILKQNEVKRQAQKSAASAKENCIPPINTIPDGQNQKTRAPLKSFDKPRRSSPHGNVGKNIPIQANVSTFKTLKGRQAKHIPAAPQKKSGSPLKETIPRFYNVRVSDGPIFLRRTSIKPPTLSKDLSLPPSPKKKLPVERDEEVRPPPQPVSVEPAKWKKPDPVIKFVHVEPEKPRMENASVETDYERPPPVVIVEKRNVYDENVQTINAVGVDQMTQFSQSEESAESSETESVESARMMDAKTQMTPPRQPTPPPVIVESPKKTESSQTTIPLDWLKNRLKAKLASYKSKAVSITKSSSTTDLPSAKIPETIEVMPKPQNFDTVSATIGSKFIDEVCRSELKILLPSLVREHDLDQSAMATLAAEIINTVTREESIDIIKNSLSLKPVINSISNEIIHETIDEELHLIAGMTLSSVPKPIPVFEVIEPVAHIESPPKSADISSEPIFVEHIKPVEIAVQTEAVQLAVESETSSIALQTASETKKSTELSSTNLSTLLSDGEMFTEFGSDGENVMRIPRDYVEKTAFAKSFASIPMPDPYDITPEKVNRQLPKKSAREMVMSDGELDIDISDLRSPGEISDEYLNLRKHANPQSPSMTKQEDVAQNPDIMSSPISQSGIEGNKHSFGWDVNIQNQSSATVSEGQARQILEQMGEWASVIEQDPSKPEHEIAGDSTTIPDIDTDEISRLLKDSTSSNSVRT